MTDAETSESSTAKARTAPAPDDPRKVDNPTDVAKPAWKYIARKTLREFKKDQCPDLAAALTYFAVLSLFPALLALVSLLGLFGQAEQTTAALLDIVRRIAPGDAVDLIRRPVEDLTNSSSAGLTLLIGVLAALWSASGYVGAFGRAMNRVYEVDEGRPFVKFRGTMLAVTAGTLLMVAAVAGMLVLSGPVAEAVGGAVGLSGAFLGVWNFVKWPVMVVLAAAAIAVLYYATPNVEQPKFRWMSIGSFIALVVFVLASLGFAFYVANFGSYNKTYGAIGGVIVMLLWLWLLNMSLLFGAEFDAEMERGRQLQSGIPAEETIQLPPRDTEQSDKRQKSEEEDIRRGRELRKQHADDQQDQRNDDDHGDSQRERPEPGAG